MVSVDRVWDQNLLDTIRMVCQLRISAVMQLLHDSGLWVKGLFMMISGEKEESIVRQGNWLFLFL